MDVDLLLKSLHNDNNEDILHLTSKKIAQEKNDILQTLQLPRDTLKQYHKKLKNYRFIDEINQLKQGHYIRWINLKNPEKIKLTVGGFFLDLKILDDECHILCKSRKGFIIELKLTIKNY